MKNEIEIKTERLMQMLSAENLGGVLLGSQANFAWATGGRSSGINLSIESGACSLFVRADGKKFVLANNIEMPRILAEEISVEEFEPVEFSWQDEKSSGDFVIEKAKSLVSDGKNIASDLALSSNIRAVEGLIARCRYELTEAEIERFRSLGKDAGSVMSKIFELIKPGETEKTIARKVKNALAFFNIESVVTLVGADDRIEKFRHPVPTANTWKKVLLIAVCAKREGLIASLSRIACVGEIPDELQRKTEAVAHVFARFLSATRAGANGAEIFRIAADAYAEKGFGDEINLHHQGGAAGYKSRDWVAHPASAEIVQKNQAFAWNPSITGTKAEETVIAGENGIEYLTASPDFPQIRTEIDGKEFFAPGILKL
ncbi:MAG TPA: M24 family metallopeptidase [Pyrinomonadaceae bacterium]|nr:M24 family metallopeptidase [Pyrinomonadaceae bacterium]